MGELGFGVWSFRLRELRFGVSGMQLQWFHCYFGLGAKEKDEVSKIPANSSV